jgi:two-component system, NtrC family, nitrogen regulation sensor histidine kinase NtrY
MLTILVISFLVTGGLAYYDHFEQNQNYNEQRFQRKEKSVKASMDYFLEQTGSAVSPDSIAPLFNDKICELSDVHNLFIVLYDVRGNYLISTNSQTLDSLGLPYHVGYSILKQLSSGTDRAVIDKLQTSEDYTIAYWYFKDRTGKPLAITNVVYDRSDADTKDIWAFIRELGASYLVLFLLTVLAAYFLSTYISRPLRIIAERLKQVELGKPNEPIRWSGKNEIGTLVEEYNRMLRELEVSASQLAREERESAWREMAKQVAHEIKNPLTPMKLRVQHLERSWQDNPAQFEEKLGKFCSSMTEQIDTLTRIANEFSNFAKMPRPELGPLNLPKIAGDAVDLFRHTQHADLRFRAYLIENPTVLSDRDHLIRVFNNLLTNAVQAIPPDRPGIIWVQLRQCGDQLVVRVSDNGEGIPEESLASVFVPNFTTKTTGSGIGLTMVKSMISQSGGQVWVKSKPGKGASFYFSLPVHSA